MRNQWLQIDYYQTDRCTFWAIILKNNHGEWHMHKNGAVIRRHGDLTAETVATAHADKISADIAAVMTMSSDKNYLRSRGDVRLWSRNGMHRLTVGGVAVFWESRCSYHEFLSLLGQSLLHG